MLRPLLAILIVIPLGWQAAGAVGALYHYTAGRAAVPWSLRLTAGTDERIRRALGDDAELVLGVRGAAAPGSILVVRQVGGDLANLTPEQFQALNAKNGLILQLVTLTYPDPWVIAVPEPLALVEQLTAQGRKAELGTLAGDPEPAALPGWSCVTTHPRFRTWRFQKG